MSVAPQPQNLRSWLTHSALTRTEAEETLCHVLRQSRSYLFAHGEALLSDEHLAQLDQIQSRRLAGEPLAYILGVIEFWSLSFEVNPAVLIPRDDTGCLVETGLALLEHTPTQGLIIDAGTGSGAVAVAFAHETGHQVIAIDQSSQALDVARRNAERLTPGQVHCQLGNWLEGIDDASVRLLLSNPPYIAQADPHLEAPELQHEPVTALVAGSDGLSDIRTLCVQARRVLMPGGALALEHGFDQGGAVRTLLESAGFVNVATATDLAGHDRVTFAIAP